MPGLLSSIFDGSSSDGAQNGGSPASDSGGDDASDTYEASSSSYAADADGDLHLDPSITFSSTSTGDYETPDGTTHTWERTDEVTLTTDIHVGAAVDTLVTIDDYAA